MFEVYTYLPFSSLFFLMANKSYFVINVFNRSKLPISQFLQDKRFDAPESPSKTNQQYCFSFQGDFNFWLFLCVY